MINYDEFISRKFSIAAPFYDLFDLVFVFSKRTNPRYGLLSMVPNRPLKVLDVCCGTGNGSIIIAEANDKNEMVAIDSSADMLAVAERKVSNKNLQNVSFWQMDATKMNFEDGRFDIVMVSFGLHELEYPMMMDVLKEICRVLKDGGKLYIVDYEEQERLLKRFLLHVFVKIFEPKHISQFLKYDWNKILQSVGFQISEVKQYNFSKLIFATKGYAIA